MDSKKMELLAPAGDLLTAVGAINAGANAVYLGAPLYSARAFAKNLTMEEIIYVIHYAHLYQAKVYLAMNTLLKNPEFSKALELIEPLYMEGLDGIIIQDCGFLTAVHEAYPSLELHASTQMAVLSRRGCEWLKKRGVVRVVPGRELSLDELKEISNSGVEVECFIHGAMCYSYSGRCLMSSLAGGRSGNRGRCAGPCRKCYTADAQKDKKGKQGYFLSMKDMCALPVLNELKEAGVCSLKIEGRMKDPAYAAGVCEIYRKYLDIADFSYSDKECKKTEINANIRKEDRKKLASLYIRSSLQEGYYHKHNGVDMITISSPSYQSMQEERKEKIYEKYINQIKKVKISIAVSVFQNCPIVLTLYYKNQIVEVEGETAQTAIKKALSEEDILKQMDKLGDSFFAAETIQVYTDNASFVPVKALNHLRREGIAKLETLLFPKRTDADLKKVLQKLPAPDNNNTCLTVTDSFSKPYKFIRLKVQVESLSQFLVSYEMGIRRFILQADNLHIGDDFWKILCEHKDCEYYYKLPDIVRENTYQCIQERFREVCSQSEILFHGIYCSSFDALALAEEYVGRDKIIADHGVYVMNQQSEDFLLRHAAIYTVSYELNSKELQYFAHKEAREIVLYGRQDVMHSANCIYKTLGKCDVNAGYTRISDEQGREFPVFPRHKYCYNTIYNCEPLSLHSYISRGENKLQALDYRMIFTTESPEEIRKILTFYKDVLSGKGDKNPRFSYTTGHMKRGVD